MHTCIHMHILVQMFQLSNKNGEEERIEPHKGLRAVGVALSRHQSKSIFNLKLWVLD